jgi:acetyl/propionyl-CoA carboxylase alpha subunit
MFQKVLVANRGEIAVRILKTCERLGIPTVAVFSDADVAAPHVRLADEAVRLGPPPVRESYLNLDAIRGAIEATGATAVHPGYGLLSESPELARAVADAGAVFVGPPVPALAAFGDKLKARAVARAVGVAPPPGSDGALDLADPERLAVEAERIGYPVLVKAAGGGGGIGMQVVTGGSELERAARSCADRGRAAFGDERVYLERYLSRPRHIEVQVVADRHGQAVALGERDCTVQRRHQKILEESPSPAPMFEGDRGAERRRWLLEAAVRILQHVGYEGAGTVEFVADGSGELYFLEVNARLQVEHPVTEMVTGLDLVELQLRVAAGEALPASVLATEPRGHAIEARLYAEDPGKRFMPQPGRLEVLEWPPATEGVRVDSGVEAGSEITPYYDPMIAKVIAHGATRTEAIARLEQALATTRLSLVGPKGPKATNLHFLRRVLADARFLGGDHDTGLAEAIAGGAS